MRFLYIHGANSSSKSWDYIRNQIGGEDLALDYHSAAGFDHNLDAMGQAIQSQRDLFIVAHSLGGVYALHLANQFPRKVLGAITISTPYGGSGMAEVARWILPHAQLFKDIVPSSRHIIQAMSFPLLHPWCQIVTTRGATPWVLLPNDGVVTLMSQRARPDMDLVELNLNHYDVMTDPRTVEIIRDRSRLSSR